MKNHLGQGRFRDGHLPFWVSLVMKVRLDYGFFKKPGFFLTVLLFFTPKKNTDRIGQDSCIVSFHFNCRHRNDMFALF